MQSESHTRNDGECPHGKCTGGLDDEQLYQVLFRSIDQAFCILEVTYDLKGCPVSFTLIRANPAFARQTGLADLSGTTPWKLLPELEAHWKEAWTRVAKEGQTERFASAYQVLGRWYETCVLALEGPNSRHIALLFVDVTARVQIERMLREADRRKDEFLATLAHELRNPLAAICTALDVMRIPHHSPGAHEQSLATIGRQSRQLVSLVDELLELSRIAQGKLTLYQENVVLADLVRNAVDSVQGKIRAAQQELWVDLPKQAIVLNVDPHRITQVLTNLLDNAAKYTPAGGRVTLAARKLAQQVEISVIDTGIGIPSDKLDQVFEKFAQLDQGHGWEYGGLGLGLTLAKTLVEMHGGTILAASAGPGEGSCFTLNLPGSNADLAQPTEIEADSWTCPIKVLLVEDNQDVAQTLEVLLVAHGCDVRVAHNGLEGIAVGGVFHPDLILMDLGMPQMDGLEACRRIRRTGWGSEVRIVAVTGWGQDEDRHNTQEAGFDQHFVKPISVEEIKSLLASM